MKNIREFLNYFNKLKDDASAGLLLTEGDRQFRQVSVEMKNQKIQVDFLRLESMSSELFGVKVFNAALNLSETNTDDWQQFAGKLCQRISYLSENLRTIELDQLNKKIQIRSYPPFEHAGSRLYFELLLDVKKHELILQRRITDLITKKSERTPFIVNEEILERLLSDLTEV